MPRYVRVYVKNEMSVQGNFVGASINEHSQHCIRLENCTEFHGGNRKEGILPTYDFAVPVATEFSSSEPELTQLLINLLLTEGVQRVSMATQSFLSKSIFE